ncbi:hypothetical protein EJ08DRAFT_447649 [Tothia fuscella]|uniref:SRR1-like domain-containing protein n=1 Tax=Tothia fuscella TaxID=1048955 RepID=A0A9P4NJ12_9PEZI|nr:hypothetical protein EJ08DRAFT_447649 [Tothia fuscella]
MARKTSNRSSAWQKPSTVDLSDGWSLVTNSKARAARLTPLTSLSKKEEWSEEQTAKLIAEVADYLETWKSSDCFRTFSKMIQSWSQDVTIDNIICLGLGSLCTSINQHKRRSIWQLVVFLSLSELLSTSPKPRGNRTIKLYAQEPRFTAADRTIFQSYGITVLENLDARNYITPNIIIYAPFLQWTIMLQDILRDQNPAMCISLNIRDALDQIVIKLKSGCSGASFEGTSLGRREMESCVTVGEAFLVGREDVEFPDFELDANALRGLRIYTKVVGDVD